MSLIRRAGFTVIEILVAIVVLGLAFVGILGLLVASTRQAGQVVEDTFASTLARSVYDSVRAGVRDYSFAVNDGGVTIRGFLLNLHTEDGGGAALPALPGSPDDTAALTALRGSDQVIFLPPPPGSGGTSGGGGPTPPEMIFVFPRPGGVGENGGLGTDNFNASGTVTDWGTANLTVTRTYQLDDGTAGTTGVALPDNAGQYSFTIAVQRAAAPPLYVGSDAADTAGHWTGEDHIPKAAVAATSGLYEIRVQVYRNFDPSEDSPNHYPVRGGDYVGLIAVGP